jgi:predicted metalloprotease with PDZ domain
LRSAVEMSQFAPFVDGAVSVDRNNFANTYLSYYTWGAAIALGLDLALRDRTDGGSSLDDYMRALWERFGRPGARTAGHVETPYTIDDLRAVLADVSGDETFARDFFARYIEGRDVVDYGRLLARAGFVVTSGGKRAFAGALQLEESATGVRIAADVPLGSPAYEAGLARDDVIMSIGSARSARAADVEAAIAARRPGDTLPVVFERGGIRTAAAITLVEDPRIRVMAVEDAGVTLTSEQRQHRDRWLSSAARYAQVTHR